MLLMYERDERLDLGRLSINIDLIIISSVMLEISLIILYSSVDVINILCMYFKIKVP